MECAKAVEVLKGMNRVTVLHHWDCDGIASAVAILAYGSDLGMEIVFKVPPIEVYEYTIYRELGLEGREELVVVDYAIYPRFRGVVFDHHRVEYRGCATVCNPVAAHSDEMSYPATTVVLHKYLGIERLDLVALGILGDLGSRALKSKWASVVVKGASTAGLSVDEFVHVARILNSCYASMDVEIVEHARKVLAEQGAKGVLSDGLLTSVVKDIEEECKALAQDLVPELKLGKLVVFRMRSKYAIVSKVGRALAESNPDKVVVLVGEIVGRDIGRIYVRSASINLRRILEKVRELGIGKSVGGKDQVFSVLCKSKDCDPELKIVLDVISRELGVSA